MRLLFDQNLSPQLAKKSSDLYPTSIQVQDVALETAMDSSIWEFARSQGYTIVTKDSDFHERRILSKAPCRMGPPRQLLHTTC